MIIKSKGWAKLLIFVMVLALVAACSAGGSGTQNNPDPTPETENQPEGNGEKEAAREPIEVVFYSTSGDFDTDEFMAMFGNKINEQFPHVTPRYIQLGQDTGLDKLIMTGETIDIIYLSSGQTQNLLKYDLQYDITELIEKFDYDLDRVEPTALEIQRMLANGGIYGLPVFNNTITLFYNRDIFDEFGVDYPKDGLTWDELYELARSVSNEQYQGITLSMNHNMLTNQFSIPFTDDDDKVNYLTDDFRKLFTAWTRFYQTPGNEVDSTTVRYGAQVDGFDKEKRIAMFLGLAALGNARFQDHLNWDVASFPVFSELPGIGPQPYPSYFYVTEISQHKEEAFEVIAYLTSDEFQKHLAQNGLFPILDDREMMQHFGENIPFLQDKNINGFLPEEFAMPAEPSEFQAAATSPLTAAFNAVLLNEKDINTALRDASEQANKAIEEQKAGVQ